MLKKKGSYFGCVMAGLMLATGCLVSGAQAGGDPYARFRGTTVSVMWSNHPQFVYLQELLPEFEKKTGIKVEVDMMESYRIMDKLRMEAGKSVGSYDQSHLGSWAKGEFIARDQLACISEFLIRPTLVDPDYDIADFAPAFRTFSGKAGGPKGYLSGPGESLFGICFLNETSALVYRHDLFNKYGLTVPDTYDEMLDRAKFFAEQVPGVYGLTMRGETGHQAGHQYLLFASPFGASVFDKNWEPAFHKEPSLEALKYMREFVKYGPPGMASFDWGDMREAFLQGVTAMYCDGHSGIFGVTEDPTLSKVVGKVTYALHPRHKTRSTEVGGGSIVIPANAPNKEGGWLLTQWLTSKEIEKRGAMRGFLATRMSVMTDPEVQAKFPAHKVIYETLLKYANEDWRPIIPEWPEVEAEYLGLGINQVLTDQKSPEEAMNAQVGPVREIMERAGYYIWRK